MISLSITASNLVTFLTLLNLIRLYLLFHFKTNWNRFKADVGLCMLSCIMFAVLAGLFWVDRARMGREVLLQLSAIPPVLQAVRLTVLRIFDSRAEPVIVPSNWFSTTTAPNSTQMYSHHMPIARRTVCCCEGSYRYHWNILLGPLTLGLFIHFVSRLLGGSVLVLVVGWPSDAKSNQATSDRVVCLCHGSAFTRYRGCGNRVEAVGYCTWGKLRDTGTISTWF